MVITADEGSWRQDHSSQTVHRQSIAELPRLRKINNCQANGWVVEWVEGAMSGIM